MGMMRRSSKITRHLPLQAFVLGMLIAIASFCLAETSAPSPLRNASCTSAYKNKAVPPKTLGSILQSHARWLGARYDQHYHRADLCLADLHQAALKEANLERANLEGANLRRANLYQSTVAHAHMAGVDLTGALSRTLTYQGQTCGWPNYPGRICFE